MKKTCAIVLALAMISSLPGFSQKLRVGVASGLNVSTLSEPGNLFDNEALKTGFGGGLVFRYSLGESFGLQSGFVYEQKGFDRKSNLKLKGAEITGLYNYITFPLLAEGSMVIRNNTRLYGVTGAYIGFRTLAENTFTLPQSEQMDYTGDDDIQSVDYGWSFGGGVQVPVASHIMQFGFRYSLGLAEVADMASSERNKSVLFGATLFF